MTLKFIPINVRSFDLSCVSRRAIINSTAFLISRTLSSLAVFTPSMLRSYIVIPKITLINKILPAVVCNIMMYHMLFN